MAPVVMSPEQEARHCLLSCQPATPLLMYRQIKVGWRDILLFHFHGKQTDFVERCVTHAIKNNFHYNLSQLMPASDV